MHIHQKNKYEEIIFHTLPFCCRTIVLLRQRKTTRSTHTCRKARAGGACRYTRDAGDAGTEVLATVHNGVSCAQDVTHDDQLALKGKLFNKDYNINLPLGKRKVAIPIDATMKAYIDFADFSAANVRRTPTHIELILPDPHIVLTSSRINHDDVKEYVALMRRDFSDEELASYELQGREAIIKDIAKSNIIEQARIGATNALVPMLRQLGFDEPNIIISFRKNFTPQEVEQLVDASTIEKKNGGANR